MRATYRIALYLAVVVSLPILTAIACSTPFHRYSLAWRPDGKIIAVKGQGVKLLDANLESLGPIYKDTNFGWSIAWNPKGDELVWANGDTARIWQQSSGMLRQVLASEPNVSTITWSPNGKWIATIGNRSIVVWDASLFQKYSMLRDPMNPSEVFASISWSTDGTLLAGGTDDGKVKIWRVQDGKLLQTLVLPLNDIIFSLAWYPSGNDLLAAGAFSSGKVYLWNALAGTQVATFTAAAKDDYVEHIAWSPDGKEIAVGRLLAGVKVFDVSQYQEVLTLPTDRGVVTSIAWSPDSSKIATASNTDIVRLWDASNGKLIAEYDMSK